VGQYDLPAHVRLADVSAAAFHANPEVAKPPTNFFQAMRSPNAAKWLEAWNKELSSLSDSWYWCDAPRNKAQCRTIGVYTVKLNADGTIQKYKFRCCLDGSSMDREEMGETFQTVGQLDTVRGFAATANQFDEELWSSDVETAFLAGKMPYELYARPLPGMKAPAGSDGRPQV
jgi:hypothetical protein